MNANKSISVSVNEDRSLSFNHEKDARYSLPVWSAMSRKVRVYFEDAANGSSAVIGPAPGVLEALSMAADHHDALVEAGVSDLKSR